MLFRSSWGGVKFGVWMLNVKKYLRMPLLNVYGSCVWVRLSAKWPYAKCLFEYIHTPVLWLTWYVCLSAKCLFPLLNVYGLCVCWVLNGLSTGRYEFMVFVWIQGLFDGADLGKYCDNILICWLCHVDHAVRERHNRAGLMNAMVRSSVPIRATPVGPIDDVVLCQEIVFVRLKLAKAS